MVGCEEVEFGENVPILKRSTLDLVFRSNLVFSPKPALTIIPPNTLTAIDSTRVCLEDYHMQILAEEVQLFYHSSAAQLLCPFRMHTMHCNHGSI